MTSRSPPSPQHAALSADGRANGNFPLNSPNLRYSAITGQLYGQEDTPDNSPDRPAYTRQEMLDIFHKTLESDALDDVSNPAAPLSPPPELLNEEHVLARGERQVPIALTPLSETEELCMGQGAWHPTYRRDQAAAADARRGAWLGAGGANEQAPATAPYQRLGLRRPDTLGGDSYLRPSSPTGSDRSATTASVRFETSSDAGRSTTTTDAWSTSVRFGDNMSEAGRSAVTDAWDVGPIDNNGVHDPTGGGSPSISPPRSASPVKRDDTGSPFSQISHNGGVGGGGGAGSLGGSLHGFGAREHSSGSSGYGRSVGFRNPLGSAVGVGAGGAVSDHYGRSQQQQQQHPFIADVASRGGLNGAGANGGLGGDPMRLAPEKWALQEWYYRDPSGNIQGPFSSHQMQAWYSSQYFPLSLPVKAVFRSNLGSTSDTGNFESLEMFIFMYSGGDRDTPFLTAQPRVVPNMAAGPGATGHGFGQNGPPGIGGFLGDSQLGGVNDLYGTTDARFRAGFDDRSASLYGGTAGVGLGAGVGIGRGNGGIGGLSSQFGPQLNVGMTDPMSLVGSVWGGNTNAMDPLRAVEPGWRGMQGNRAFDMGTSGMDAAYLASVVGVNAFRDPPQQQQQQQQQQSLLQSEHPIPDPVQQVLRSVVDEPVHELEPALASSSQQPLEQHLNALQLSPPASPIKTAAPAAQSSAAEQPAATTATAAAAAAIAPATQSKKSGKKGASPAGKSAQKQQRSASRDRSIATATAAAVKQEQLSFRDIQEQEQREQEARTVASKAASAISLRHEVEAARHAEQLQQASSAQAPWAQSDDRTKVSLSEIMQQEAQQQKKKPTPKVAPATSSDLSDASVLVWGTPTSVMRAGATAAASLLSSSPQDSSLASVWKPAASPAASAKSLADIQREEELKKQKKQQQQQQQQHAQQAQPLFQQHQHQPVTLADTIASKIAAAVPAAPAPPVKRWADNLAGLSSTATAHIPVANVVAKPAAAPTPAAASSDWVTVGAKPAKAAVSKPAAAAPAKPAAPAPRIVAVQSKPVAPTPKQRGPSEDMVKWCKTSLKSLSGTGVNLDEFTKMLMDFNVQSSLSDTVETISSMILMVSTSIDGRKFANEFVKRRRADLGLAAPVALAADTTTPSGAASSGASSAGFQVVKKKKGKKAL
ncbi:hypothetical protein RI367_003741 [Sorochytrium milnesiophthora]